MHREVTTRCILVESKEFGNIPVIFRNNKLYLGATATARGAGYSNTLGAIKTNCIRGWMIYDYGIDKRGVTQKMNFIDERNLNLLTMNSRVKGIDKFKYWIYNEVIPTIKAYQERILYNSYENVILDCEYIDLLINQLKNQQEIINAEKDKVDKFRKIINDLTTN